MEIERGLFCAADQSMVESNLRIHRDKKVHKKGEFSNHEDKIEVEAGWILK